MTALQQELFILQMAQLGIETKAQAIRDELRHRHDVHAQRQANAALARSARARKLRKGK